MGVKHYHLFLRTLVSITHFAPITFIDSVKTDLCAVYVRTLESCQSTLEQHISLKSSMDSYTFTTKVSFIEISKEPTSSPPRKALSSSPILESQPFQVMLVTCPWQEHRTGVKTLYLLACIPCCSCYCSSPILAAIPRLREIRL